MPVSNFICPHCMYDAPLYMFENVDKGIMKCKRCRSQFDDPNSFGADSTYADCDSRKVITRFRFALNGKNSMIHVREGYLALIVGNDGRRIWLHPSDAIINDMPFGFQLYYICLTPRLMWGTQNLREFGSYGIAQLTVSEDYVTSFCNIDNQLMELEDHLAALLNDYVTDYVEKQIDHHATSHLESSDGYSSMLGIIEDGISLTKIAPMGCRNANGYTKAFTVHLEDDSDTGVVDLPLSQRHPVDSVTLPKKTYTISTGDEEVFLSSMAHFERHKAGEVIDPDMLRGVKKLLRFHRKEFDFDHGWGLYNQPGIGSGYFSAHGIISFFVDSTEQLSKLLAKTDSWEEFTENFFSNVLKKEIAGALKGLINDRAQQKGFDPDRISDYLSAMSVEMTSLLNGEGENAAKPAFKQYGLRVSKVDILHADFYSVRR